MERSRLKTIIILILAMMNLALALSLGLRLYQGRASEAALLAELRQRFTAVLLCLPFLLRTNRKGSMALLFLPVTTLSWILRWIEP